MIGLQEIPTSQSVFIKDRLIQRCNSFLCSTPSYKYSTHGQTCTLVKYTTNQPWYQQLHLAQLTSNTYRLAAVVVPPFSPHYDSAHPLRTQK